MDIEKLYKAASDNAEIAFVKSLKAPWPEARQEFAQSFKAGADWLMQQPLSERLSEEEKEKIKGYLTSAMFVYASGSHASLEGLRDMFIDIFGADLFNPNQPTAI